MDFKLLESLAAALAPADEIARLMGVPKSAISKALKDETGQTLEQYIGKIRWKLLHELRMMEMELARKSEKMALFLEERLAAASGGAAKARQAGVRVKREYVGVAEDGNGSANVEANGNENRISDECDNDSLDGSGS